MWRFRQLVTVSIAVYFCVFPSLSKNSKSTAAVSKITGDGPALLWQDPQDIGTRNLLYGPGGQADQPQGTLTFTKEDLEGSNPKFDATDQNGTKWKVKMGLEARPETVATRFVWAVGYHADEDYFLPEVRVNGLPASVHRGQKLIGAGGTDAQRAAEA